MISLNKDKVIEIAIENIDHQFLIGEVFDRTIFIEIEKIFEKEDNEDGNKKSDVKYI